MQPTPFQMPLPENIRTALGMLEVAGFEAYLVGGCVRDALMGNTPEDYDIATSALPSQIKAIFASKYKVIENGIKHGTVTPVIAGKPVEITTYRKDGAYSDKRHPDSVQFCASLKEDLSRRDFTVNAFAFHPARGLVDCFGGEADLKNGVIRCVGDADKRFEEDALRIIRALRFAAVLGFRIEATTAGSMANKMSSILSVSAERIYAELKKLLAGKNAACVLTENPSFLQTLLGICLSPKKAAAISSSDSVAFSLAVIIAGEDVTVLKALKPETKTYRLCCKLNALWQQPLSPALLAPGEMARFVFENALSETELVSLLKMHAFLDEGISFESFFASFQKAKAQKIPMSLRDLAVNGEDLQGAGLQGKAIKQAQEKLLHAVCAGKVKNKKNELMNYLIE